MLDLSFGLPIVVRDAALKMVAPGPESSINREYYAQEHEKEIEEGRGGVEEYEKTDEKARELLRRLATSEPYYKRQRRIEAAEDNSASNTKEFDERRRLEGPPGPIRTSGAENTQSSKLRGSAVPYATARGGRGGRAFPSVAQIPPQPQDILPPQDRNITSLFVTGVEDDLPEHAIRSLFSPFGVLRSLICSHRSHCAFINYATREAAEAAAEHCQGKAVIQGCPLRVQWGRPRPLDNMEKEERMSLARQGRDTAKAVAAASNPRQATQRNAQGTLSQTEVDEIVAARPPGQEDVQYPSLAGS